MSNVASSRSKRDKWVHNIKNIGDVIMYIGSAALTIPSIQKSRENQNGLMGSCAVGAGAMISVGMGKVASNIFNKVVDKAADFFDDVKSKEGKNEKGTMDSSDTEETDE